MTLSHSVSDAATVANAAEDEAIWRPRVTVATVVPRDGRFLLVEEDIRGRLMLNQPAGHLDPDESLATAAVREALEETAWDIELECLVCVQQWSNTEARRQFVRFTFAGRAVRHHADRPLDHGIVRALWLTREEIAAEAARLRSPMVLAGIDDWIAGQRLPLDAIRWFAPSRAAG